VSKLSFISDEAFSDLVDEVIAKFSKARLKAEKNFFSNAVDPFAAIFEASLNGLSIEEWFETETTRQVQKTLSNAVGEFHQKLLGSLDGWVDYGVGSGIDLRCESKSLVAEVKNKHNTMNSSSAEATFDKLANWLRYRDKGFTAYVVTVVPKSPTRFDKPWTHSTVLTPARNDIRIIDGASFYDLATGEPGSLALVYSELQKLLEIKMSDHTGKISMDPLTQSIFKKTFGA